MARKQRLAGVVFLGVLIALGIAPVRDRAHASRRRPSGAVQAPRFEVDFTWPRPLPNHWVLGNAIGVWADERDHIWIVHRGSETLANNEKGLELKSGDCCAAAPPVLEFDRRRPPGRPMGRTRTGLRLAGFESRHLHRSRRQRLDRRQRSRRLAHRQVHARRQVPRAVRQAERAHERQGQAGQPDVRAQQPRPGELRPRREDLRRSESERGVHRRRLLQQARRGDRRGDRQDEALLGRLRQEAR